MDEHSTEATLEHISGYRASAPAVDLIFEYFHPDDYVEVKDTGLGDTYKISRQEFLSVADALCGLSQIIRDEEAK